MSPPCRRVSPRPRSPPLSPRSPCDVTSVAESAGCAQFWEGGAAAAAVVAARCRRSCNIWKRSARLSAGGRNSSLPTQRAQNGFEEEEQQRLNISLLFFFFFLPSSFSYSCSWWILKRHLTLRGLSWMLLGFLFFLSPPAPPLSRFPPSCSFFMV